VGVLIGDGIVVLVEMRIMILSRWVRWCARLVLHQDLASWCRASGCVATAGASYVVNSRIIPCAH
jgi:hypothetical protein